MKLTIFVILACVLCGCGEKPGPTTVDEVVNPPVTAAEEAPSPTPVFAFREGIDSERRALADDEVSRELNDLWALLVLRRGSRPATLDHVLGTLSPFETAAVEPLVRASFVLGEGSQIPLGTSQPSQTLDRRFRLLVAWDQGGGEGIFLGAPAGDRMDFLEVISWDPEKKAFNYYERQEGTQWVWRGDTRDAFDARSRGRGCFRCHTNGNLVMKELKRPWNNWASEDAPISAQAVPAHIRPPDLPRVRELFDRHTFAPFLEQRIRSGIQQANEVRVLAHEGTIRGVRSLFRQLIDSRNVNLISSRTKGVSAPETEFMGLPLTFFVNAEAFSRVGVRLAPVNTSVRWNRYRDAVGESGFQFALSEGEFRQPGDTYFAFLVPEPAAEDIDVLRQMLEQEIVTPKLAASLLMVDFPNSVYSPRRNHLLRYLDLLPDAVAEGEKGNLSAQLIEGVRAAAEAQPACAAADPSECSPEQELLLYWSFPDESWRAQFAAQIQAYLRTVSTALQTEEGLTQIIRLSISRRRDFRENVPGAHLAETSLLFPQAPVEESLQMTRSGLVTARIGEIPSAETPAH